MNEADIFGQIANLCEVARGSFAPFGCVFPVSQIMRTESDFFAAGFRNNGRQRCLPVSERVVFDDQGKPLEIEIGIKVGHLAIDPGRDERYRVTFCPLTGRPLVSELTRTEERVVFNDPEAALQKTLTKLGRSGSLVLGTPLSLGQANERGELLW